MFVACFMLFSAVNTAISPQARAQDAPQEAAPAATTSNGNRSFYGVLDELLADFEYDIKQGQVMGLKDLSIRNIVTSENIPVSFKANLELLITEKILKNTKARVVHCQACRAKNASFSGDNMVISSPETNAVQMQRLAKMNGIGNFMDVAFAYQPSGMILSLQISDIDSGTTLWSKSYNSQTSRAAMVRRGMDPKTSEEEKMKLEYLPTIQVRPMITTAFLPKAGSGYSTALGFGIRVSERYDNRSKEVGFEMDYYADTGSLSGSPTVAADKNNIYASFNLTMLFVHSWSVFGNEDNINKARGSIFGAIGGTYASGFLGGVIRAGYDWHLAKHWVVTTFAGYRPKSTLVIQSNSTAALSGIEGGLGVGFTF